jgi:hypothetical protein
MKRVLLLLLLIIVSKTELRSQESFQAPKQFSNSKFNLGLAFGTNVGTIVNQFNLAALFAFRSQQITFGISTQQFHYNRTLYDGLISYTSNDPAFVISYKNHGEVGKNLFFDLGLMMHFYKRQLVQYKGHFSGNKVEEGSTGSLAFQLGFSKRLIEYFELGGGLGLGLVGDFGPNLSVYFGMTVYFLKQPLETKP